jgi:small subunit ribosomal protein S3
VGQKTHPRGFRLGIIETWDSKWYSDKEYAVWLHEDLQIQKFIKNKLARAGISRIEVERVADKCSINIHTARPGIVIGRRGVEAEKLQVDLEKAIGRSVRINVTEIKTPELDAQLVAEAIAMKIQRRSPFRQAVKRSIAESMRAGAQGVKATVSGRLGGIEMARTETSIEGRVPLHTLRARIDYGFCEPDTTYGKIGVKTWIFKGEVIGTAETLHEESSVQTATGPGAGPSRPRRRGERFGDDESTRRRGSGRWR